MSSKNAWGFILDNSNLIYYFMRLYGIDYNHWDDCYQEVAMRLHKHLTRYNTGVEHKNTLIKQAIQAYIRKQCKRTATELFYEEVGVAV